MNTLTLLLIRLAFLAVLWLFVIAAVGVVRTDLFGPSRRPRASSGGSAAATRRPPSLPALRSGPGRGEPQRLLVTAGALAGTTPRADRPANHHRSGK